jgi:hypothetical protein
VTADLGMVYFTGVYRTWAWPRPFAAQSAAVSASFGDMGTPDSCWRCKGANPVVGGACERCREYLASDEVRPVEPYEPPVIAVDDETAAA